MKNGIKKIKIAVFLLFLLLFPGQAGAYFGKAQDTYPKLLNVYLKWQLSDGDAEELARWDALILDMQIQENNPDTIKKIRRLNPDIFILPRVPSEEFNSWKENWGPSVRNKIFDQIGDEWLLKDSSGNELSFWSGTTMLNITDGAGLIKGKRWNEFLPEFVKNEILSTRLWDGIFYDNIWSSIAWFNNGNLDINRDQRILASAQIDKKWQEGNIKLLSLSKNLFGNEYLVTGNAHAFDPYHGHLNGFMLENFPPPWEAGGTWAGAMKAYTRDAGLKTPKFMMINANTNNTLTPNNYRKMRFSLGSALLGNGYFSFNYGDQNHAQTWWYDEYDVDLGRALGAPYNILDKKNSVFKDGVWRRDFEKGIVIVNSTAENKNYVFSEEEFSKINGAQDRTVNNGARINMVSMLGKDAVVLLGTVKKTIIPDTSTSYGARIKGAGFNNGGFFRVFDENGNQTENGFFSYLEKYPAGSQILIADINGDGNEEELVNYQGVISIYKNGKVIKSFSPYDGKFKGEISFAVSDLDGDGTMEIITGAGAGGGPHVRIFDKDGRPLIGGFFAYDKNFRGGVSVAVLDLNGDGIKEIITGAGPGGGPHVRVFDKDGRPLIGGFFAYDKHFRGGISIAVGNVNGGFDSEIITGAGPGGGPEVKIFNKDGRLLRSFFAYDKTDFSGIKVMAFDSNNNGLDEIFVNNLGY